MQIKIFFCRISGESETREIKALAETVSPKFLGQSVNKTKRDKSLMASSQI